MAEIITPNRSTAPHKRCKKNSTKIDLTPMVDLGFLLITFFVFTTAISRPNVMTLILPKDKNIVDESKTPEGRTISLLLGSSNRIYYYNGLDLNQIVTTNYAAEGLRTALLQKLQAVKSKYGSTADLVVLIKPTALSSYENLVNTLDEMLVCGIKTYVLMDADTEELDKIKEQNQTI